MRQKRAKAYKKRMAIYQLTFGFREPYQVLVDRDICMTAQAYRMDIEKHLTLILQGNVKTMITQCCIEELYSEGPSKQDVVNLAKRFERRKCNHREPIAGADCLKSVVGDTNKHRYVVATQLPGLREWLRTVPGVPIVLLDRSVMVLESLSEATLHKKSLTETQALLPPTSETTSHDTISTPDGPGPRKRRGPRGPNPLSVKKKKRARQEPPGPRVAAGLKRKRAEGEEGVEERAIPAKRKRRRRGKVDLVDEGAPAFSVK